ncbi:5-formyltetrahydrofolate cyclo-ligase [Marinicella rhabdoformis]|uniref:5-formyltetrahydrofolate cyclo-ligase n=1 Tax=Marinicella rhabdoformis TaxID=2580566 RepID=UPI0012AEBE5A|nr:5-formyltetrahydrofolate cyclo-ligase [Marinicella rhabdoformis]
MNDKNSIRQQLKSKRQALTADQVTQHSHSICQKIINTYLDGTHKHIGIYLPFGNEVNLQPLLSTDSSCYIPSINKLNMQFQLWTESLKIQPHSLGMKQPLFIDNLPEAELDICFMPLLGYDKQSNRLGMGGGFYDRYFENNRHNTKLIGVAHDCQFWPSLPHDDWDVTLDGIVTESQHLIFQK